MQLKVSKTATRTAGSFGSSQELRTSSGWEVRLQGHRRRQQPEGVTGNACYPNERFLLSFQLLTGGSIGKGFFRHPRFSDPAIGPFSPVLVAHFEPDGIGFAMPRRWLLHRGSRTTLQASPGRRSAPPRRPDGLGARPRCHLAHHWADIVSPAREHLDHRHEPRASAGFFAANITAERTRTCGAPSTTTSNADSASNTSWRS